MMASGHSRTEIFHDEQDRRLFSHAFRMQGEDEKVDSREVAAKHCDAKRQSRDAIFWRALICDTVRRSFEGGLSPIFVTRLNLLGQAESSQGLLAMVCNQLSKRWLSSVVLVCPQAAKVDQIGYFESEDRCSIH